MNLFSLYATLTLDTKDYEKKVNESEELTKKFAFDTKKAFNTVKTGLKIVATAAAGFVTMLGKTGLEYNAQMESYTTDFEVMLGSAADAAEKVEALKKMAAKTPFELTNLADSTKMLLAFNVANEDTNKVLQQLGDISLGDVQKLESLTRAYGKMNASQKVTLEDLNIMIDSGFNPLLSISEKTGESMTELYSRVSKGGVAFSEIQEAIAAATSEGGQFYQGMEKASQTTQGLISTLKDLVNSKAGEFFASLSEKIKELLPQVISFVENIDAEEILTDTLDTITEIKDTFIEWLPVISGVSAAIFAFRSMMTISVLIDAATKAITAFKTAQEAATLAQAALNFVMNLNSFVLIATLIAGVTAVLITLWVTNEDFRNAIIGIWGNIQQAFVTAVEKIKSAWDTLVAFFKNLWDKITATFDDIISKALQLGKDIIQNIKNGIRAAWDGLVSWFNSIWDSLFGNRNANVTVNTTENRTINTINGSHRSGLNYVPFDGYIAELHKGERVLTADEARAQDGGKAGGVNIIQNIYSEAKTAADLMSEALYQQERAVLLGV